MSLPHELRSLALDLRASGNWAASARCELLTSAADALSDAAHFRAEVHRALWLLDDGDVAAAQRLLTLLCCSSRELEIRAARAARDARTGAA